ncbi:MAG TPA: FtsX-like permease family protein [Rhodocyclaceae bacterium]|nr:FtsX-like permease family protein [Rhodocyclaceae bacterium]
MATTLLLDLWIALRNQMRQPRRTAFSLLIIVGGTVAYLLAGGFIEWTLYAMREATIYSHLGHIQIVRPDYFQKGIADPYAYLLPEQSPELDLVRKRPEVQTLAPRLAFGGLISHGDASVSFLGEGVDPIAEVPLSKWVQIVSGQGLSASAPRGLIMGEGLALNLGVKPGDTVVLLANTKKGGVNAVECTVRGLFYTAVKAYDDTTLRLPIETARSLMRVRGATTWIALLKNTDQTDTVIDRLRSRIDGDKYQLVPWIDLADFYVKTRNLFSKQVEVVKLIIAVIIVLSISNTLSMAVIERTPEIGTVMSLGTRRRDVLRQFLIEGGLLGITGGIAGVAIGAALAHIISSIGIPMPAPPGASRGFTGQIQFSFSLGMSAFMLSVVTTLLASAYPAWKASRTNIVDALRHNR